jgi:hypothetical protein
MIKAKSTHIAKHALRANVESRLRETINPTMTMPIAKGVDIIMVRPDKRAPANEQKKISLTSP